MSNYCPPSLATLNQGSPAFDAFGRLRAGLPETLWDSKLIYDKSPLLWDEATVAGSGFTSTYLSDEAAVELETDGTVGRFVRQTFMRFNYQPGKSQAVNLTGVLDPSGTGTLEVVKRSNTSGSVVDTAVSYADFNGEINPEGYGKSDLDIDLTKTQIFTIDFEWLGVGQARMGAVRNGQPYILHYFQNDNINDTVYMRTPNLPIRYEIEVTANHTITRLGYFDDNNGLFFQVKIAKGSQTMKCICSTVISEGGTQDSGVLRYKSTEGTQVDANTADTVYACIGLRLKSTHLDATVKLVNQTLLAESADDFEWIIKLNPTVAGTFTYSDETNSAVQTAVGATANTVTGGIDLLGGFGSDSVPTSENLLNSIRLGASIIGDPDELVLCVRPLSINLDIQASLTWREQL